MSRYRVGALRGIETGFEGVQMNPVCQSGMVIRQMERVR